MSKEFLRMQKLAGLITESKLLKDGTELDSQGNIIYSLYDENSDWDFSDDETFKVVWTLDGENPDMAAQNEFEWDDEDFSVEVPIKDIMDFLKNSTGQVKNFTVSGGYLPITKRDAAAIIDSYYENQPDEINPNLN